LFLPFQFAAFHCGHSGDALALLASWRRQCGGWPGTRPIPTAEPDAARSKKFCFDKVMARVREPRLIPGTTEYATGVIRSGRCALSLGSIRAGGDYLESRGIPESG
jgi:hypothetical protein